MSFSLSDPVVIIIVAAVALWAVTQLSKTRLEKATEETQLAKLDAEKATADQQKRFAQSDVHISVAADVSKQKASRDILLDGGTTANTKDLDESKKYREEVAGMRLQLGQLRRQRKSKERDEDIAFLTKALIDKEVRYHERFGKGD